MLLSGTEVAAKIEVELKAVLQRHGNNLKRPKLAILLANANPASEIYVQNKLAKCAALGCDAELFHFPQGTKLDTILTAILRLNVDTNVHGILCQLPLFPGLDEARILQAIDPKKDVDGLHPENLGLLAVERPRFIPCTPQGILWLLDYYKFDLKGRHAVVLGRSNIVGKPMAMLLASKAYNMTVSQLHSASLNPASFLAIADLVVVAIGRPHYLRSGQLKKNAVVIDVGINPNPGGVPKLVGDADYRALEPEVRAITPVPKGVGPMTIISLMANLLKAAGYPLPKL